MEAYDNELEKIIGELELELDSLLTQRKNMFFTFRLDAQILRIKNLLKKHKAEGKKSKEKSQIKKTMAFIRGLIRRILGLNSTASKLLKERKQTKKSSPDDKEDSEPKDDEKEETKQTDTKSEKKKPKEKIKQRKPQEKESLFTHVSKEGLGLLDSIHPKTLDIHLLSLLELEKSASEFTSKQLKQGVDIKTQPPINKQSEGEINLNEEIKKYHDAILNILNKPTRVDITEDQLRESNSYNIKQLYLLNNYLLRNQEKKTYEDKSSLLEFIPLLITPLLKLEVLMQALKKYITSSSGTKKQKVTAEKTKLDTKEYSGIAKLEHLARIKNQQDGNTSYVEKHRQSKIIAYRQHGSLK